MEIMKRKRKKKIEEKLENCIRGSGAQRGQERKNWYEGEEKKKKEDRKGRIGMKEKRRRRIRKRR
jgi:hypothetical protein